MKTLLGIPAAQGVAIGSAHTIHPFPHIDASHTHSGDAQKETLRLDKAIAQVIAYFDSLCHESNGETQAILLAQREMADDPELLQHMHNLIKEGAAAESAALQATQYFADQLSRLDDPYLAARADDVRDIGRHIIAALLGISLTIHLVQPVILIAHDISPADLVQMNHSFIQAIATETGSATGHLAIVAQGLGIPVVVGAPDLLAQVREKSTVIIDGDKGNILLDPDQEAMQIAEKQIAALRLRNELAAIYLHKHGMTSDGVKVEVFANISSAAEATAAVKMGCEGVGLFRTEFLAHHGIPSEDSQYALYQKVAAAFSPEQPIIIRTFDIGGDKPVAGLDIPPEENPFLGWRGIRLALDRPETLFLPQLRALLRVGATHDIRVMLPMVALPDEVIRARKLIKQAMRDLQQRGIAVRQIPVGMMIETPAAAVTIDLFEGLIDFASIGTNDLTQYTYAADRANANVQQYTQTLGPALLRMIYQACQTNIPIAVCGKLAGDIEAIPILVGLGVRELSVPPHCIPEVKSILASATLAEMRSFAMQHLMLPLRHIQ